MPEPDDHGSNAQAARGAIDVPTRTETRSPSPSPPHQRSERSAVSTRRTTVSCTRRTRPARQRHVPYRATGGASKSGGPRDAQRRRGAREVRPEAAQHANHLGTCEDDEVPHRALQVQVDGTRLGLPVQARLAEALDELPLTEELREPEARQALVPGARDRQGRERRPDAGQEAWIVTVSHANDFC